MAMYKVKVGASYGWVGTKTRDEIEFEMPDNATPEEVQKEADKLAWEWACERIDCYAEEPVRIN